MLTRCRNRYEVERTRPEAIRRTRQRTDRADLDCVSREIGIERLVVGGAHLLLCSALQELEHGVAGNLIGETRTASTRHTPLTVEEHLSADVDRLIERPLVFGESRFWSTNAHRLVLQRTLTALVAHGAIQRMVEQQELHDALLRFPRDVGTELRSHLHAVGDDLGAGRLRLGNTLDLDQARPTGGNRIEQRVVTETGNFNTEHFRSTDHEGPGRHRHGNPVDDDADEVGSGVQLRAGLVGDGHRTPAAAKMYEATGSNCSSAEV